MQKVEPSFSKTWGNLMVWEDEEISARRARARAYNPGNLLSLLGILIPFFQMLQINFLHYLRPLRKMLIFLHEISSSGSFKIPFFCGLHFALSAMSWSTFVFSANLQPSPLLKTLLANLHPLALDSGNLMGRFPVPVVEASSAQGRFDFVWFSS